MAAEKKLESGKSKCGAASNESAAKEPCCVIGDVGSTA
jgi:hypothetical protein